MDLLAELRNKLDLLAEDGLDVSGLRVAVLHIEVAERYLSRGRVEREASAFNDVIYRTNQAFEGMLKEAYRILAGPQTSKLTPFDIERALETTGVLAERVQTAVRRYRQEWRNPSTHDHVLTFTDQDGLLAIMSVSTFAAVLLDQVAETVTVRLREAALQARPHALKNALAMYQQRPFHEQIATLLSVFGAQIDEQTSEIPDQTELAAVLAAFLCDNDPDLQATVGARVGHQYVDIALKRADEVAVLQLRRGGSRQLLRNVASELGSLLAGAGLHLGFVYVIPQHRDHMLELERHSYIIHQAVVFIVFPCEFG